VCDEKIHLASNRFNIAAANQTILTHSQRDG
jgi:hypothetical protein